MPFNNLDSTAAQISRMTPQQRQQFAQMHKTDPIMMSLVSFVQNQDEALRAAQMAKMTGQEPPKVVDQVINSINPPPQPPQGMPPQGAPQQPQVAQQLPENTGIAALPAPNMQQMADGGITGYQDDLYVPDDSDARMGNGGYNFPQGESVIRMADGTPPEMFSSDTGPQEEFTGSYTMTPTLMSSIENIADPVERAAARKGLENQLRAKGQSLPPQAIRSMSAPSGQPRTAAEFQQEIKSLQGRPEDAVDPFAVQGAAISQARQAAAEKEKQLYAEDIEKMGLARKGQEERIGKREQALSTMEEKNSGLALLQAGLAMMQSKGRGLAGIAEGAGVGLNAYKSGMDKISSAKEKIDEARDQIEQYRRNEDMLTSREKRAIQAKIESTKTDALEQGLAGTKEAFRLNNAQAAGAVKMAAEAAEKQQDNATKLAVANITANAPPAQLQMYRELGGNNLAEGIKKFEELKREAPKPPTFDQYMDNAEKFVSSSAGMTWANQIKKAAKEQGKPIPSNLDLINMVVQNQMDRFSQMKSPSTSDGMQAPKSSGKVIEFSSIK